MKAIKSIILVVALATDSVANSAIIATYDITNTGQITGFSPGIVNETGTAVIEDIGDGQAVMTIDKEGVTNLDIAADPYSVTSRLVYQGTLSGGVFTIVSGQNIVLSCTYGISLCSSDAYSVSLQPATWTALSATPSTGDGGGLPLIAASGGIVYDNLFHVADATENMATRVWALNHVWSTTNKMAFTNTTPSVPVPAAAWLLGSGLLGLTGIARRRAAMRASATPI